MLFFEIQSIRFYTINYEYGLTPRNWCRVADSWMKLIGKACGYELYIYNLYYHLFTKRTSPASSKQMMDGTGSSHSLVSQSLTGARFGAVPALQTQAPASQFKFLDGWHALSASHGSPKFPVDGDKHAFWTNSGPLLHTHSNGIVPAWHQIPFPWDKRKVCSHRIPLFYPCSKSNLYPRNMQLPVLSSKPIRKMSLLGWSAIFPIRNLRIHRNPHHKNWRGEWNYEYGALPDHQLYFVIYPWFAIKPLSGTDTPGHCTELMHASPKATSRMIMM